jgi:hypothetical protein
MCYDSTLQGPKRFWYTDGGNIRGRQPITLRDQLNRRIRVRPIILRVRPVEQPIAKDTVADLPFGVQDINRTLVSEHGKSYPRAD